MAQEPGVPQDRQLGAHHGVGFVLLKTRSLPVDEFCNRRQPVKHALSADFRGVGRDHGQDRGLVDQAQDLITRHPRLFQLRDGRRQCVRTRAFLARGQFDARSVVFGQIGHLQEERKGMGEFDRFGRRQPTEILAKASGSAFTAVAVPTDRSLANVLDLVEGPLTCLGLDHLAQQPAEAADIVTQV